METYSQRDPRWAKAMIGKSDTTIGDQGCLITAMCQARLRFYPYEKYPPSLAAKDWEFVPVKGDPQPRYLLWGQSFNGFRARRVFRFDKDDLNLVKTLIGSRKYAVVIEVLTRNGGRHWLCAKYATRIGGVKCHDPWNGDVPLHTWGFLGRYVRPTGYAVLEKEP